MALLEVRGLVKKYGARTVVNGVSFEVNKGEVVGLLGPNGAGKTTSFRMATGQVSPNEGQVWFDSKEVTHLPMFRRARLGMGYLSQEPSIFRKLTVEQNLIAILEALPQSRTLKRALTRSERWQRTEEALARFSLLHVRKNPAASCSGGEKRRLEIARCLVCEPLLILLDEPFAAVDPLTTEDIRKNIRELALSGIGILVTDHNVREVLKITDRSYLIKDGKVIAHGTPDEIKTNQVAIDGYLGRTFEDDAIPLRLQSELPSQYQSNAGVGARVIPPPPTPEQVPPDAVFNLYLPTNAGQGRNPDDDPDRPPPSPNGGRPSQIKPTPTLPAPPAFSPPLTSFAAPIRDADRVPTGPPPFAPSGPGQFSGAAQQTLEYEKLRRIVLSLTRPEEWAAAWHEITRRGMDAVPVLLETLESSDLELRHIAFRLLEQITGEMLTYQSDAPEEVRFRQIAYLRTTLERRRSA